MSFVGCQRLAIPSLPAVQLTTGYWLLLYTECLIYRIPNCGAFQDAEYFFLAHDQEVFAVNLDLGAGVLAKQDAVAFLHIEREGFTFVVGLAPAHRDHFALLRLVLGAVRDNDSATGGL